MALRMLYFEDLSVGMTETLSKTISSSDVVGFAQLTGDRNPIHLSEHFAARTSFGREDCPWPLHREPDLGGPGHAPAGSRRDLISQTLISVRRSIGDEVDVQSRCGAARARARSLTCICKVADEIVLGRRRW